VALYKVASDAFITFIHFIHFIDKVARDESVCWQQPLNVGDGCLTI
jgi:hypothetical protein